MRYIKLGSSAALFVLTSVALAQTPPAERARPTPEETQKIMDSALGAMGPAMGRMAESMIESELRIAEKPETADRIAAFKKNLYDSLIKKGFKPGEALQIVMATGLPSASSASR